MTAKYEACGSAPSLRISPFRPAFYSVLQRAQISIHMSQAAKSSRYMMHPVMLGF